MTLMAAFTTKRPVTPSALVGSSCYKRSRNAENNVHFLELMWFGGKIEAPPPKKKKIKIIDILRQKI